MTPNLCGWWAFAPGGFHTEAFCALPHGHDDDHRDESGRTLVFPADARRLGTMCAVYDADDSGTLCAREPGHEGQCRNQGGYVFAAIPEEEPRPTEVVVTSLWRTFAHTPSEDPVKALRVADEAFGVLDSLMRSGSPLPRLWEHRTTTEDDGYATEMYDELSEALRFIGDPFDTNDALCAAAVMWKDLDNELLDGAPLPTPWRRP